MSGLFRAILALIGLAVSAQLVVRLVRFLVAGRSAPDRAAGPAPAPPLAAGVPRHIPVEPGMQVLQLGPADPALVRGVARQVGKYGKVFVVERSNDRAQRLAGTLRAGRVGNVEVLTGDPARLELPDSMFDLALCVRSLADQPRRQRALWELQRVLRPGGRLSVTEALRPGRYLRRGTLKHEASAVGLVWRDEHGSPLDYIANFRKTD